METNINANTNIGTSLETTHTIDLSDRLYKLPIAMITVVGLVGAGWVFSQFSALPQNMPHEISVSGEGKAYLKPDVAMVSFGVSTQELKSQDAVNKNNEKMNAVIAAIKAAGVDAKDIQTTLYNLTPLYDYPQIYYPAGSVKSGSMAQPSYVGNTRVFSGYSLEQQVSVKIRNFEVINTVLDKATAAGANTVGQLSFTMDNPEAARSLARTEAIKNAKEKLEAMAKDSGLRVGKLVNISEGYNNYPQPMYGVGLVMKDSVSPSVAPEIQVGQQEITSSVTLTYQIK